MESKETLNINYTAVIKELDHIEESKTITDKIGTDYQSKSIFSASLNEDKSALFIKMEFGYNGGYSGYNKNLIYKIISSVILDIDYITNP